MWERGQPDPAILDLSAKGYDLLIEAHSTKVADGGPTRT